MQQTSESKSKSLFYLLMALCLGVLVYNSLSYLPFMTDDAYISLRYAKRVLQGLGLTWTAGQAVEGYTNFLWVMTVAALGALGIDLELAARILGLACMAAALIAVMLCTKKICDQKNIAPFAAGLVVALSGPIAVWAVGGLEQPLLTALLAWACFFIIRQFDQAEPTIKEMILPGILLGLICLTRADGALFTVSLCFGWITARGFNRKAIYLAAALAGVSFLFFAGHLIFRLAYYGQWVPNTALIKTQFSAEMLFRGIKYLIKGLLYMAPLAVFWLLAFRNSKQKSKVFFLMTITAIWGGYVVLIGGDYFVAHRHLVPLVPLLAVLAAFGIEPLKQLIKKKPVLWIVAVLIFFAYGTLQAVAPQNQAAKKQRWERNGEVVGRMLKDAFYKQQPLVAVTAAGVLPYYSDLPALDMLGLNDRHIATHSPKNPESFKPAHQFGDGAYVLSCKPDLVIFCEPGGCIEPIYRSGIEMVKDPAWKKYYRLVRFEGEKPFVYQSKIYVRAEDGRVGVQRGENQIDVPGFLFSANSKNLARLDEQGKIAIAVSKKSPADISNLMVRKGSWSLSANASGPVFVQLKIKGSPAFFQSDSNQLQFELSDDGNIDLKIIPKEDGTTYLYDVKIERPES